MEQRICQNPHCGATFHPKNKANMAKYCCKRCRNKMRAKKARENTLLNGGKPKPRRQREVYSREIFFIQPESVEPIVRRTESPDLAAMPYRIYNKALKCEHFFATEKQMHRYIDRTRSEQLRAI